MSFFGSLFGKKKSVQQKNEEDKKLLMDAIRSAEKIVHVFGEFIESPQYPGMNTIADTKILPYEKEVIKEALKLYMKVTKDEEYKKLLKTVYTFLADFQEGVGETNLGETPSTVPEIKDKNNMTEEEKLAILYLAKKWTEKRQEVAPFEEKVEKERELLALEVAKL
jgi:uncharacterized protein YlaN (UPF0358 family)